MTIQFTKSLCRTALILIAFLLPYFCSQGQDVGVVGSSYDQLVVTANSLLKEGKLEEAKQTAQQAIRQNASGYMAYAVAAKIASQQGASADAANFIQKALQLAPDDDSKAKVQQLAKMIGIEKPTGARDWTKFTIEQIKALAATGEAEAEAEMASCYYNGWGVGKDLTEAVNWNRKAAEHGYVDALNRLGYDYQAGQGVEKDFTEAATFYRKAAEQGNAVGQYNLGLCYERGWGVKKDFTEAAKWYRKSAEQGLDAGQISLGVYYDNGQGIEKNYTEAVKWFRKAADQGNASAQLDLGICYESGHGVDKNLTEAATCYRKAADQGNAMAQMYLGVCYENGRGVDKDLTEAIKWYRKSDAGGYINARANLRRLGINR